MFARSADMARKKKCDASKVSKPPSIDTADDGYYTKKGRRKASDSSNI